MDAVIVEERLYLSNSIWLAKFCQLNSTIASDIIKNMIYTCMYVCVCVCCVCVKVIRFSKNDLSLSLSLSQ